MTGKPKLLLAPENKALDLRFRQTLAFIGATLSPPAHILDLGAPNRLSKIMTARGYLVRNTEGDLDIKPETVHGVDADAVTAFEILEHLVSPYPLLRLISAPRLFATVPLRMWFAGASFNPRDTWDRHYHEFEEWQFDWLLDKAGWKIIRSEKWISPAYRIGIRPLLRRLKPRYYAVEAVRKKRL